MDAEPSPLASMLALLRWHMDALIKAFGQPDAMRLQRWIYPAVKANLLGWLRPLEAAARRILIALALETPLAPPSPHAPREFPRRLKKTRRLSFRVLPRPPRGPALRQGVRRRRDPFAAAPLAARIAALHRVAMAPGRYAARLARRLRGLVPALKAPKVTDAEPRPAHVFHRYAHELYEDALARLRGPPEPGYP